MEDEWNEKAKELCKEGLRAKFAQNPYLLDILLETGDKTLIESGYDKVWGTGIPLHDVRCLDPTAWRHQGILGELLGEIRQELRTIQGVAFKGEPVMEVAVSESG